MIYQVKRRPKNNPLIVHFFNRKDAEKEVVLNDNFFKLYRKLCPGPITFVLNKRLGSKIHPSATNNMNTVAIRFPSHKIIRSVLKKLVFLWRCQVQICLLV